MTGNRELNHSPPSSAKAKNSQSCTSSTRGQGQICITGSRRLKTVCYSVLRTWCFK
jgi:hypothetical protein